jgi:hypothetical protein
MHLTKKNKTAIAQLLAECNQYQLLIRHPQNVLLINC